LGQLSEKMPPADRTVLAPIDFSKAQLGLVLSSLPQSSGSKSLDMLFLLYVILPARQKS